VSYAEDRAEDRGLLDSEEFTWLESAETAAEVPVSVDPDVLAGPEAASERPNRFLGILFGATLIGLQLVWIAGFVYFVFVY
jgi:hypothetical protein